MIKSIVIASTAASVMGVEWLTRCEYDSADCSSSLKNCAQLRVVDGCLSDQSRVQFNQAELTYEEGGCDGVTSDFTDLAVRTSHGSCVELSPAKEGGAPRFTKFFFSDDGANSLRDYSLDDLRNCGKLITTDEETLDKTFVDSYDYFSEPFNCLEKDRQNTFSFVSVNGRCNEENIRVSLNMGSQIEFVEYESADDCTAVATGVADVESVGGRTFYYRGDGSCHIGMYTKATVNKFAAHADLCGEPAASVDVELKPVVCATVTD